MKSTEYSTLFLFITHYITVFYIFKYFFQVVLILTAELINRKKTEKLLKNLYCVDQRLTKKHDYEILRFIMILIFIVGFFIFCRETRFQVNSIFTISNINSLFTIYYVYMITYAGYFITFKFAAICYMIHQRLNTISQILTDYSQKEANVRLKFMSYFNL